MQVKCKVCDSQWDIDYSRLNRPDTIFACNGLCAGKEEHPYKEVTIMGAETNDKKAKLCAVIGWIVILVVVSATVVFSIN